MHRFQLSFALTGIVLASSLAATAIAQEAGREGRRRGGFEGFGPPGAFGRLIDKPTLLGSDQVRTELKISADQTKKVDAILTSHRDASMEIFSSRPSRDASEEERAKAREEVAKKNTELLKKTEAKLADALEKAQIQRLDEIALQQQGADALVSDQVIASIKLTKEQVEKIRSTLQNRDAEVGKLRGSRPGRGVGGPGGGGGGNFEEMREKSEKLRKDAETTAFAVMSKDQGESFAKLKGTPFELDRRSLFPGRGGQRPGGGGKKDGAGSKERRRPPADDAN